MHSGSVGPALGLRMAILAQLNEAGPRHEATRPDPLSHHALGHEHTSLLGADLLMNHRLVISGMLTDLIHVRIEDVTYDKRLPLGRTALLHVGRSDTEGLGDEEHGRGVDVASAHLVPCESNNMLLELPCHKHWRLKPKLK